MEINNQEEIQIEEIWKQYTFTGRIYYISNLGRCKCNGNIIEPCEGRYQEWHINTLRTTCHRAVAELFCEKPDETYNIVHHINEDKHDNRAVNLMWMTSEEHSRYHALRNAPPKEITQRKRVMSGNSKPLIMDNLKFFQSSRDASDWIKENSSYSGAQHNHISACARGKQKTSYGHVWRYATDLEIQNFLENKPFNNQQ